MQRHVTCADCGLKYGVYSTFHLYPDEVEKERQRHNCRLIQLCRSWEKLVRGPSYWDPRGRGECDGDPPDARTQAAMVDAEDRAAVARAVFEARTAAYARAEARACCWTFAAARAARDVCAASAVGPPSPDGPPEVRADRMVAAFRAHVLTVMAACARAAEAERAARRARADVAAKADALELAMDAVARCASEAGVLLPARRRADRPGDAGRIVFADVAESDREYADSDAEDDSDEYVTRILNDSELNGGGGGGGDDDDYYRGYGDDEDSLDRGVEYDGRPGDAGRIVFADSDAEDDSDEYVTRILNDNDYYYRGYGDHEDSLDRGVGYDEHRGDGAVRDPRRRRGPRRRAEDEE